jgi:hypothetical protein
MTALASNGLNAIIEAPKGSGKVAFAKGILDKLGIPITREIFHPDITTIRTEKFKWYFVNSRDPGFKVNVR